MSTRFLVVVFILTLFGASRQQAQADDLPRVVGIDSCTARACHGGPLSARADQPPPIQSAATFWLTFDRHAEAFAVLQRDRATQIMARLAAPGQAPQPADLDARCLACHSIPTTVYGAHWGEVAADAAATSLRTAGVGCEACHGPAQRWLGPHTAWNDPATLHSDYRAHGMTWLNSPADRASVCVGCHVGAPADPTRRLPLRDVTHELIAAGHPRLTFELSTYLARLPPHWRERDRQGTRPRDQGFEGDLWLAGQVAIASAALDLVREHAKNRSAWPEFADLDCFACHHDLAGQAWRQTRRPANDAGPPGRMAWNSWNLGWPLRRLANDSPETSAAVSGLQARINVPVPDPNAVEIWAGTVRGLLARPSRLAPARYLDSLGSPLNHLRWDEAGQAYHALAALSRDRADAALDAKLQQLADRLTLPRGPAIADRLDSPRHHDPETTAPLLGELLRQIVR